MSTKALILIFCVYYSYENDFYDLYQISDTNCGETTTTTQKFIIGGSNASENEFPFMALMTIRDEFGNWCGATLISSRYALTAAHCLQNREDLKFSLLMATNNRRNQGSNTLFEINQRITPECYGQREIGYYDIALIRLAENPMPMNTKIKTICLPPKNSEPIGDEDIFVAGWGLSGYTEGKDDNWFLQKAKMELRSEEYCRAYSSFSGLGIKDITLTGDRLCLKSETSTVCQGDSGGPAFQKVNGKWYQIGIASYGFQTFPNYFDDPPIKCFKSAPSVYVKTSAYIDWIQNTIKNYWNSSDKFVITKC